MNGSNKPASSVTAFNVQYGLLCAVAKSVREQGQMAARMLLAAMQGTPLPSLPITHDTDGKRMINVTVMRDGNQGATGGAELVAADE